LSIQKNKSCKAPAGNTCDKYNSRNPAYRYLVNRFLRYLETLLESIPDAKSILDVGCGEGYIAKRIEEMRRFERLEGIDASPEIIEKARRVYPGLNLRVASACSLPFKEGEFDLLSMCEVLEHLCDFEKALCEAVRVAEKYVIISVPVEPVWRVLNIARGKYILSLGNTPGHVQHWGKRSFRKLLEKHCLIEKILYPLPWQIALCKKK